MSVAMTSTATARVTAANHPDPGPSQATAPVLEFRCLWTRDTHKKAKKWHDGSLRYHTFNRRVMVYDESNYHIGDVHYRGEDEVGEGTELTLDRPIMVEVGEPVGQTVTDLNQVLHHRPAPERPPNASIRSTVRSSAVSQSRPKTIKEVLGASQGQQGRSRVQYQSPYDQRKVLESSHPAEPPPKRVKINPGKENVAKPTTPRTPSPRKTVSKPQRLLPSLERVPPTRAKESIQELLGRAEEVYNLSSDEEPALPAKAISKQPAALPSTSENVAAPRDQGRTRPRSGNATSSTQNSAAEKGRPQASRPLHRPGAPAISRSPSPRLQSTRSIRTPSVYTPRPGTTQLQFSRERPRRKLMYRALLPSPELRDLTGSSIHEPAEEVHTGSLLDTHRDLVDDDAVELDRPRRLSTPPRSGCGSTSLSHDEAFHDRQTPPSQQSSLADTPIDISSSPLFVPQDGPHTATPAEVWIESSQEFETRVLEGTKPAGHSLDDPIDLSPVELPLPAPSPAAINISSTKIVGDRSPSPPSSRSSSPALVQEPAPKTTRERMPPPPLPAHPRTPDLAVPEINGVASSRYRPFRRTMSANDAEESLDNEALSDDEFGGPSMLLSDFPPTAALLRPNRTPRRPSPRKSQTPVHLRRTLSDPVAVDSALATTRTVACKGASLDELQPESRETGPWTTTEAFLLFGSDLWPASKREQLPEWSRNVGRTVGGAAGAGNAASVATGPGNGLVGGFGSARGLLEKERTAQGTAVLRDEAGIY